MKTEKNILVAFLLNLSFAAFEFFGGLWTGSVAILSDAVHDLGDAAGLGLSWLLERKGKRPPDQVYTYGYGRYSLLGSLITTSILLFGSVLVMGNAVVRILHPTPIHYDGMILFAIVGVCVNFIAALLTVLGYSINATIVVFDRIRENTRHAKKQTYAEIANASINQTIGRSINTTITTLLTIGMVYIMGVTSIKAFALPIIIGIVIGTYSSIFIAGSVWATWKDSAVKTKTNKK